MDEFIRDCKCLGELMEVVPENDKGWHYIELFPISDKEAYVLRHPITKAFTIRPNPAVLLPPLSWLVRELEKHLGIWWELTPEPLESWSVIKQEGRNGVPIMFTSKIDNRELSNAPTPEGACVKALIAVLEGKNEKSD